MKEKNAQINYVDEFATRLEYASPYQNQYQSASMHQYKSPYVNLDVQ